RNNIGAGHTPKLYPTLEPTPPSWRRHHGTLDGEFSAAGDSTKVSSSPVLRPSVSARKAMPSDLYTNGASKSKLSTGLPIWLKIALCFLITIFVVMLMRRLLDDEDSMSSETMHFDE
uniref:Uncharacterized protein n=1 Tax=Romanomermis culicivorax TaxID=13658 RepID=A0A915J6G0_ROMCU